MNVLQPVEDQDDARVAFEHFDLTVYLGPDQKLWLSAHSSAGFVHAVPRREADIPDLATLLDLCFDYADGIAFAEREPMPELTAVLGRVVFGDGLVLQLFHATRGIAADRARRLLVRILVTPHLSSLPWELLPDPAFPVGLPGQRYLALAPDVQIVRMARGRAYSSRPRHTPPPLNVLLVLSSPVFKDDADGFYEFDVFEVKRALLAELAPLEQRGLLHVDVEDRPTVEGLRRRIASRQNGYHVLHFVGHALPDRIFLEDSVGEATAVTSERVVELLRLCPDLKLTVFAGCETARPHENPLNVRASDALAWRDLLSLADRCVQSACPNVLGMQAVLPLSTERIFTRYLYQSLVTGYTLVDSVRIARGAVRDDERLGQDVLDWSVPVLFVGGTAPGRLLPETLQPLEAGPRRRVVTLKLGIRQSSRRFLARDLALRQAIEVLSGRATERVLVVTGPAHTGKTALVERALEELSDELELLLFLHASNLAPEIAEAIEAMEGKGLDLATVVGLKVDAPLERLCERANELLGRAKLQPVARTKGWTTSDWWERIVAELANYRSVVVLDDVGEIGHLESALLRAAAGIWLAERLRRRRREAFQMNDLETDLESLLGWLYDHMEGVANRSNPLQAGLMDLAAALPRLPQPLIELLPEALAYAVSDALSALANKDLPEARLAKLAEDRLKDATLNDIAASLVTLERIRALSEKSLQLLSGNANLRAAVTGYTKPRETQRLGADVFEIRLASLTWGDTWRWVRRGLPGLARFGEPLLKRQWSRLASRTELWEELERRVVRADPKSLSLDALAEELVPTRPRRSADSDALQRARRGERPLRIAADGIHLESAQAFAAALTQMAINHGVAGRVLSQTGVQDGVLATVIDESIKWDKTGVAGAADVVDWLERISRARPDVVLLDYGTDIPEGALDQFFQNDPQWQFLRRLAPRSLLIGAGGNQGRNSGHVTVPAGYKHLLSIGSATAQGELKSYSSWSPKLGKPDLFMADELSAEPLGLALREKNPLTEQAQGSSYAALHAVAAAVLTWSMLPELTPRGLRRLLDEASRPVAGCPGAKFLDVGSAVRLARERLVRKALSSAPCTFSTVSAITGIEPSILRETVSSMRIANAITVTRAGRFEQLQLVR